MVGDGCRLGGMDVRRCRLGMVNARPGNGSFMGRCGPLVGGGHCDRMPPVDDRTVRGLVDVAAGTPQRDDPHGSEIARVVGLELRDGLALHSRPPPRCRSTARIFRSTGSGLGSLVCHEVDVDAVAASATRGRLALGFCLPLHPRNHTLRWARVVRVEGMGLRPSLSATSSKTAWPRRSRPF
jgi:hypothetical protein